MNTHGNGNGDMMSPPPALGRMEEGDDEAQDVALNEGGVNGLGADWSTAPERGRQLRGDANTRQGESAQRGNDRYEEYEGREQDDRFMRDAGLVGILQQIVATGGGLGR
jgi:hypothetical protein